MYLPRVINLSKIFRAVICNTTSVLLSRRTLIKCLLHIKVHALHTNLNITFSILAWLSSWDPQGKTTGRYGSRYKNQDDIGKAVMALSAHPLRLIWHYQPQWTDHVIYSIALKIFFKFGIYDEQTKLIEAGKIYMFHSLAFHISLYIIKEIHSIHSVTKSHLSQIIF